MHKATSRSVIQKKEEGGATSRLTLNLATTFLGERNNKRRREE